MHPQHVTTTLHELASMGAVLLLPCWLAHGAWCQRAGSHDNMSRCPGAQSTLIVVIIPQHVAACWTLETSCARNILYQRIDRADARAPGGGGAINCFKQSSGSRGL
jgi:hypothetical protein